MTKKGGLDPDLVAEMHGFEDGADLVRSLANAEKPRDVIDGLTDQRMLERYGELSDPQAIERAAEAAIHNEVRARFVATELKALSQATGPAKLIAQAAKEAADAAIATKRVRDVRPAQYTAAEAKSAKNADKALLAKDIVAAANEKRAQLLNNRLAKAAADAVEEVRKGVDYLKKFDKPGVRENIELEYRDQIDALLERYDLRKSTSGKPQRFTKKQMLMLAGNMGNESNVAKLIAGEKWNEVAVWDFLNKNMSKADWDFVAGMGKAIESLWPEKLAMSRRLGNTNPEKIQPRAFDTPHGRYDGWYWPMLYDPARAQDVAERGAKKADALFENIYTRANTDTGRMNTRNANYARPLLLDLDALPRVIRDEIHDIAFREATERSSFRSCTDARRADPDRLGRCFRAFAPLKTTIYRRKETSDHV